MTVREIAERGGVTPSAVRAWARKGLLRPVGKARRGEGGSLYVRGEVYRVLYAICRYCGGGFRRQVTGQEFCRDACRVEFCEVTRARGEP